MIIIIFIVVVVPLNGSGDGYEEKSEMMLPVCDPVRLLFIVILYRFTFRGYETSPFPALQNISVDFTVK